MPRILGRNLDVRTLPSFISVGCMVRVKMVFEPWADPGTVDLCLEKVLGSAPDQSCPTWKNPLLFKGYVRRGDSDFDDEPSFVAVWPNSEIITTSVVLEVSED